MVDRVLSETDFSRWTTNSDPGSSLGALSGFDRDQLIDRIIALEKEKSNLQEIVRYLLRKNEEMRRHPRLQVHTAF